MFNYILKRLLFFIPTLILISIISFLLMSLAPGDPVLSYMELDGEDIVTDFNNPIFKKQYEKYTRRLHLDKPSFYFTIKPSNYPHTAPKYINTYYKKTYYDFLSQGRSSPDIATYISELQSLESAINHTNDIEVKYRFKEYISQTSFKDIKTRFNSLIVILDKLSISTKNLNVSLTVLINSKQSFILPTIRWNGIDNQYHHWISSFFNGSIIRSYSDGIAVSQKISRSLKWTMYLVVPALLLSFLLSIILGVYQSNHQDRLWSKWLKNFNYFIFSIPSFWLATILLVFIGGSSYFSLGEMIRQEDSVWAHLSKMILPIIVIVLHNLAYISRQMYHSMVKQSKQNYMTTAKAKGLKENTQVWKHQFLNALLPMITMMTAAIPAALSGSVVLELIYNIPGMGRLMYHSLIQMDWPVVFSILMFLSIISLIFMLIGDLLYAFINPKIRFDDA